MTFIDSVATCFQKYADFSGRAIRSEYWWWALFCFVASIALGIIDYKLELAFDVATFLPYLAVTTRRLHDTNRTGWWQLIILIPIIGWIVLIVWLAQKGEDSAPIPGPFVT
jgi:uncharacterized membrane protein YhaH (DUF805 family)